jgi:hypothetical protein
LSLLWPGSTINLTRDPQIKFSNYNNNHFYFYVDSGQPDSWPGLCHESILELSFKTIIITIFIFTWLSLIILELNDFYKDILEINIKNIVIWDMFYVSLLFWNYKNNAKLFSYKFIFISLFLFFQPNRPLLFFIILSH